MKGRGILVEKAFRGNPPFKELLHVWVLNSLKMCSGAAVREVRMKNEGLEERKVVRLGFTHVLAQRDP